MPELLQEMYYGPNVQNLIESDDCKVMRLSDNSGEGMMTLYHVFPGVFLMYNDFHMKECVSGFQTDMDLLCIDHCREGRIEQEVGQNAFSYLEAGDLRVDRRIHHSGKVEFPLCHYHGISIGFQVETAAKEIPAYMKGFSVDLYELQNKYCSDRTPYVIPGEPAIEHIFSELYNVPIKIKKDYFKIKVLELLLYLDALELSGHTHYGQLWPFNFVVERRYLNPLGLLTLGSFNSIVSAGTGTWGPPLRNTGRAQVLLVTVHFAPEANTP